MRLIRRGQASLVGRLRGVACAIALLAAGLAGCAAEIEPGPEPKFFRGEAVVERLSGRVGLVADGHYDPFSRGWKYRVRFSPASCSEFARSEAPAYGAEPYGTVWVAAYELRRADAPAILPEGPLAPVGDRPAPPAQLTEPLSPDSP